jgi:ABC-type branched-subunit amino acid transport system substrate-binding protein/LysM repeat protein
MKAKEIFFLLLILFLSNSINLFGQGETQGQPVKKSTDKVKIEGKYYYIHIVRKGETLYSISKTYNVSQMEIAMENPDIYLGLQVDQALKIPINDISLISLDQNKDDDYIYHIVRKGETLFGLSKKYSISIQDIIATNPEVELGVKISQVILIPKQRKQISVSPDTTLVFIYHEVQPKEGFYSLYKKYGVTEQTIKRFNAHLVSDGLRLGTILRIPKNPKDTIPIETQKPLILPITQGEETKANDTISGCNPALVQNNKKAIYNVALLLPLLTKEFENPSSDSLGQNSNGKQSVKNQIPQRSINFLDFYQGAMLAIDSMKNAGLSLNLWVYDTNRSSLKSQSLLQEKGLKEADLIVGPIYPETIKPVSEFARENKIPIVSPLSTNNYLLSNNPYLIQVNPSFQTQLKEFSNKVNFCDNRNIVIIHDADSTNDGMLNSFKELIKSRIQQCNDADQIHFKEVSYSPGSPMPEIQEKISHSLVYEKENLIIVPSNNEAFVVDLLGNLHTLATYYNYPISLYGFPRWQRFKSVQLDYYYQLQLHLFTPFHTNYSNPNVKEFVEKYRVKYRAEPSMFSFQGYDVFLYFLSALNEYGSEFRDCLPNHKINLLQSEYSFTKTGANDGYENSSVYLIKYTPDFEIVRLK